MKNINIPGVGTIVMGDNVDELLDVINTLKEAAKEIEHNNKIDIREGIVKFCNNVVKCSIKEGMSITDFMNKECFDTLDAHPCVVCIADKFNALTIEDIKSIGAENVVEIVQAALDYHIRHSDYHLNRMRNVIKDIEGIRDASESIPNYDAMTKEELIALLKDK